MNRAPNEDGTAGDIPGPSGISFHIPYGRLYASHSQNSQIPIPKKAKVVNGRAEPLQPLKGTLPGIILVSPMEFKRLMER